MKYIILVGDGMADRPLKELGNKTCLQKAHTPNMDRLASEGKAGKVRTIPAGFEPGSDVANLSILGYNPAIYYSGRAPIEAVYRGIKLGPKDVAFRCNLVTLDFLPPHPPLAKGGSSDIPTPAGSNAVMLDYSAGHITTNEARLLIKDINNKLGSKDFIFYPGVSYRHLMIWKNGKEKIKCTPPHDITGKKIGGFLPQGKGAEILNVLMEQSTEILLSNSVNKNRIKKGLRPANSIWFWGQGRQRPLPKFRDKYKLKGALISAVDLTKGLGLCAGFDIVNVKGATGYIDTNYSGKAKAALKALKQRDLVYVHVEAPDEAGHNGDMKIKIQAIEDFDSKVVGMVLKGLKKFKDYRILLLPDHATPIKVRTHTPEPVPFVIYDGSVISKGRKTRGFSEDICRMKDVLSFEKGHKLMDYFIRVK
ncbi:MAG: cofactor-independent phosphoglycerate mutase [Nitrospirae bacterium]|nr:cofactor-independent phosphoglycerate mutase [Nitrospirota bacterium]